MASGLSNNKPEAIIKYYFLFEECYFENPEMLNVYKRVLFTDGEAYAPEIAKKGFNFPRDTEKTEDLLYEATETARQSGYGIEET